MTQEWNAQRALKKWILRNIQLPENKPSSRSCVEIYFYNENEDVPLHELENALVMAAKIVDESGPDYLPVFERMEREIEAARLRENSMKRARQLSAKISFLFNSKSNLIQP